MYDVVISLKPLLWSPCKADAAVISIFPLFLFFLRIISAVGDWMSTIPQHMMWPLCKFRMHCLKCAARSSQYRKQKLSQKSLSAHHRTTLLGYMFATKACIDNQKKNLLDGNISSICPHNMVNFGPLMTGSVGEFGASQQILTGFVSWLHYCTDVAQRRSTKPCRMFGCLLGWYTIYTFSGALAP